MGPEETILAHYTLVVHHLAPIPVNHRIKLEFYAYNFGSFKEDWRPNPQNTSVTDLDTGIVWNGSFNFRNVDAFELSPDARLIGTYWGKVVSCEVISGTGDSAVRTRLVVFPTEGPADGSPYRGT